MKYYKYKTNMVASGYICAESFEKAQAILILLMLHNEYLTEIKELDYDLLPTDERIAYYTITKNRLMHMVETHYNNC